MIKRFTGLLFLACLLACSAQGQAAFAPDFGSVPDSLFAPGQYPAKPEVPFIYSLKKMHVTFSEDEDSIVAELHYHVRVKVFDASAKAAAVVGIPYYFKNHIEQVSNIRGYTYHRPDQRVPLDPQNVRTININSRYNVKEFTMPSVKDGSVIEYVYTIRRRYIEELPDFYFSNQVPTKRAEVSITYPKYLRYQGIVQDYDGPIRHFTTRVDTSLVPKIFTFPQPTPIITEKWQALDVPAVRKEPHISTLDDYRGKIKFQLSEFGIPRQPLENSWNYVVAEIRRKQHIFDAIESNNKAYKKGAQIAKSIANPVALQDSIFRYVKRRVSYSGSKTPFSTAVDTAVLNGTPSDQAAINQTLAAMLHGAGIQAWPVLISSRKSGQINRSFPSFFQFNGQLVYSNIRGEPYFMDASYGQSRPNLVPVDMLNQTGLLITKDDYRWVTVQPEESAFTLDVDLEGTLDRQGNLTGTLHAVNEGYAARKIQQEEHQRVPAEQIIRDVLLSGYSDAEISQAELQNKQGGKQLSAHFTIPHYAVSYTDGLDFRPLVVGYLRQNPFDTKRDRNLPVTLDAPQYLNLDFTIHLPGGFSLDDSPLDQIIQLPGAKFGEDYTIRGNTLKYTFHINISQQKYATDMYPKLLRLYNRWVKLSNDVWHVGR